MCCTRHAGLRPACDEVAQGKRRVADMSRRSERAACPFDPRERDLIRREFGVHFGQPARLSDGMFLRTWRSGPEKGQPKLPPALRSMLERGLVEVRPHPRGVRAFFSESGFAAMRLLLLDRRLMNPESFAHLRAELGLDESVERDPD
jgi:hypothetical protein